MIGELLVDDSGGRVDELNRSIAGDCELLSTGMVRQGMNAVGYASSWLDVGNNQLRWVRYLPGWAFCSCIDPGLDQSDFGRLGSRVVLGRHLRFGGTGQHSVQPTAIAVACDEGSSSFSTFEQRLIGSRSQAHLRLHLDRDILYSTCEKWGEYRDCSRGQAFPP